MMKNERLCHLSLWKGYDRDCRLHRKIFLSATLRLIFVVNLLLHSLFALCRDVVVHFRLRIA